MNTRILNGIQTISLGACISIMACSSVFAGDEADGYVETDEFPPYVREYDGTKDPESIPMSSAMNVFFMKVLSEDQLSTRQSRESLRMNGRLSETEADALLQYIRQAQDETRDHSDDVTTHACGLLDNPQRTNAETIVILKELQRANKDRREQVMLGIQEVLSAEAYQSMLQWVDLNIRLNMHIGVTDYDRVGEDIDSVLNFDAMCSSY